MNGKKAKQLRRLARECSIGLRDVAYHGDTIETAGMVKSIDGRQRMVRRQKYTGKPRELQPNTTRAVYQELKAKNNDGITG